MAVILSYNFPVLFTSSRFIIAIILIHFFLYPFANSVHFQVSRFSHDQHNIIYQGDAVTFAGTIELNRVDYMNRIGQVVYAGNVPIWDSNSGKVSDFTTHFSIIIDTQNLSDYGHGLAFFLAPVGFQIPLNSAGGFLGPNSSLSYGMDMMEAVQEWVTIGFSATTGQNVERNILLSWEFNSSLEIKQENGNIRRKKRKIALAVVLPVAVERRGGPRRFAYGDLALATNNFSKDRKLGEGGFGEVYRGYLVGLAMTVAVKKISKGSKQGKKEYITEVKIISSFRHRNLVQLIASALLYLHEEWEQCVIHRDIKSSNIMLNSNFKVKIGAFGLARLFDHELEIACGRKTSDVIQIDGNSETGLVEWIWNRYGKGELYSVIDQRLKGQFDPKRVECLVKVGIWSAHPDRNLRPSIRQVIQVLNF
ncbi:hypothetical protein M9H77_06335 [Catharanthus roseus]|uniref:Uncharacterized protein n=1 Tax=Catharanthus roseus TaxID=4058 RepID=A0ACC0BRT7_CATRO|nr:hypothetical protein M9H77_06335 [Catharanthus roseus]